MRFSVQAGIQTASVNVMTSDDGGLSSEQITELAMDKILYVGEDAPPAIKDQALQFKEHIARVVFHYIELARKEECATIVRTLEKSGNADLADIVRRL